MSLTTDNFETVMSKNTSSCVIEITSDCYCLKVMGSIKCSLLPAFVTEGNNKFQLEVNEKKDVSFSRNVQPSEHILGAHRSLVKNLYESGPSR